MPAAAYHHKAEYTYTYVQSVKLALIKYWAAMASDMSRYGLEGRSALPSPALYGVSLSSPVLPVQLISVITLVHLHTE